MERSPGDSDVAREVNDVVKELGDDGRPRFERREIRDFLVSLVLERGLPLSNDVAPYVDEFLLQLPPPNDESPAAVADVIRAYFIEHPVPRALVMAVEDVGRQATLASRTGFQSRALQVGALHATGAARTEFRAPVQRRQESASAARPSRGLRRSASRC